MIFTLARPGCGADGNEVVGAARGEHGIGGGEGDEPHGGHAGRCSHQQLLRHAHLDEAVRICLLEDVEVGVLAEVGGQPDDVAAPAVGFDERVAERSRLRAPSSARDRGDHRRRPSPCRQARPSVLIAGSSARIQFGIERVEARPTRAGRRG